MSDRQLDLSLELGADGPMGTVQLPGVADALVADMARQDAPAQTEQDKADVRAMLGNIWGYGAGR